MTYTAGTTGNPKGAYRAKGADPKAITEPVRLVRSAAGRRSSRGRTALPLGAGLVRRAPSDPRRHRRPDAPLRSRARAAPDPGAQGQQHLHGAHAAQAHRVAARERAALLRRLEHALDRGRGGALPVRGQAPRDRPLRPGALRVLRRLRDRREHADEARRAAHEARLVRQGGRRRRHEDPRRPGQRVPARRPRRDLGQDRVAHHRVLQQPQGHLRRAQGRLLLGGRHRLPATRTATSSWSIASGT